MASQGSSSKLIASSGSSTDDGPECLLQHANEVRKHANLDTLDAFLAQSGYSWIEMMISHAKDSYEGYQSSSALHRSNSVMAQAFEHKMAAELLKTPSPKKPKRFINALNHKLQPSKQQSNDPFSDDINKENRSSAISSSPKKEIEEIEIKPKEVPTTIIKNTRSRGDQSELIQLPNPFQPKVSKAKEQSKQKSKEDEITPVKVKEPKKVATKTKVKAKVDEKIKPVESKKDLKAHEPKEDQIPKATVIAAPLPKKLEQIDFIDDSQEVEYSLQVVKNAEEKTINIKPSNAITLPTSSPARENEKVVDIANEHEDEDDVEEVSRTRDLKNGRYESSSPRESTPPPLSPTKAQRKEQTMKARERLEKSLLKLASDDEESDEEDEEDEEKENVIELAQKVAVPISKELENPTSQSTGNWKVLDEQDNDEEQLKEEVKKNQTSAPKRTLSSMAHAKKSIVGTSSSSRPQGRGSSMVPSATSSGAKTSFLSKSIMRVEQDQQSLDDSLDLAVGTSSPSTKSSKSESKKRKSEEVIADELQAAPPTKSAKILGKSDQKEKKSADALKSTMSKRNRDEEEKQTSATNTQMQSLREKIESFNTNKTNTSSNNNTVGQSNPSRNFSSMSTHAVGLGATKISSPIFSRSNSQNSIAVEPQSPGKEGNMNDEKKEKADTKDADTIPISTTPLNSPGPAAKSLYPNIKALQQPQSPIKAHEDIVEEKENVDDLSDVDGVGYDTSTDGELSLNDLIGTTPATKSTIKPTTTAPRPPGTNLRATSALPKTATTTNTNKSSAFMPSSAANGKTSRPVSRLGKPIEDQSGASAVSSASSQATTASTTTTTSSLSNSIHATWGGSISSKLKGILGFSSTSPNKNNTAAQHMSASTITTKPSSMNGKNASNTIAIPVRKDSVLSSNNVASGSRSTAASTISTTSSNDKRPASVMKADLIRKKEAEQAEKRAKEKEERAKASAALVAAAESAKKRVREENAGQNIKSKPTSTGPSAGKSVPQSSTIQRNGTTVNQSEAKKRKSNDGVAIPIKTSTITKQVSSQALKTTIKAQSQQSKIISAKTSTNPTSQNTVFSDHNPFQKAQSVQQNQALAAVSHQMQIHKSKQTVVAISPDTKMKMAATGHIELEEPDSAYSDSDDEETIQKRLQHKPWETREGLASALEAQSAIDADLIFGIPQGAVPLDDILPAQSEHARVRRMRPRSSSATWSRDGLKQFEIDRYNERMGIKGPGVLLGSANVTRDDGSGTPSRAGRMSALAQSAIAQGQVSNKKQRP